MQADLGLIAVDEKGQLMEHSVAVDVGFTKEIE